eukprot:scaffold13505_cov81-Skeletonema_dohrnii-CCMP3373.AAC.1
MSSRDDIRTRPGTRAVGVWTLVRSVMDGGRSLFSYGGYFTLWLTNVNVQDEAFLVFKHFETIHRRKLNTKAPPWWFNVLLIISNNH